MIGSATLVHAPPVFWKSLFSERLFEQIVLLSGAPCVGPPKQLLTQHEQFHSQLVQGHSMSRLLSSSSASLSLLIFIGNYFLWTNNVVSIDEEDGPGSLSVPDILTEVKKLQNLAYQLGQEETKEMTR